MRLAAVLPICLTAGNGGHHGPAPGFIEIMHNVAGSFFSGESYPCQNMAEFIVTGDVNGDCIPDVLFAGFCFYCGVPNDTFLVLMPGYSDGGSVTRDSSPFQSNLELRFLGLLEVPEPSQW
jgi:hypothetical protein